MLKYIVKQFIYKIMYPNKYKIEHITDRIKDARKRKGLSQRELSERSGVPQSHISRIENGTVDLRLSSLIELARTLDMELVMVPRKAVPAVQSIADGRFGSEGKSGAAWALDQNKESDD